jgi:hypothetical protein
LFCVLKCFAKGTKTQKAEQPVIVKQTTTSSSKVDDSDKQTVHKEEEEEEEDEVEKLLREAKAMEISLQRENEQRQKALFEAEAAARLAVQNAER